MEDRGTVDPCGPCNVYAPDNTAKTRSLWRGGFHLIISAIASTVGPVAHRLHLVPNRATPAQPHKHDFHTEIQRKAARNSAIFTLSTGSTAPAAVNTM